MLKLVREEVKMIIMEVENCIYNIQKTIVEEEMKKRANK